MSIETWHFDMGRTYSREDLIPSWTAKKREFSNNGYIFGFKSDNIFCVGPLHRRFFINLGFLFVSTVFFFSTLFKITSEISQLVFDHADK